MGENSFDFRELSWDRNLKERMLGFRNDVEKASEMLETFFTRYNYDELSSEDKVRYFGEHNLKFMYDLFLAFAINSYFWMYLRIRGVDPNQHDLKAQINRVREYMSRSKKVYERNTIMPRIDQGAAKRFVKSGLWAPKSTSSTETAPEDGVPAKRKKNTKED